MPVKQQKVFMCHWQGASLCRVPPLGEGHIRLERQHKFMFHMNDKTCFKEYYITEMSRQQFFDISYFFQRFIFIVFILCHLFLFTLFHLHLPSSTLQNHCTVVHVRGFFFFFCWISPHPQPWTCPVEVLAYSLSVSIFLVSSVSFQA